MTRPSTRLWPDCTSDADFERVRRDEPALTPGVQAICAAQGLDAEKVERFTDGSLPVYAVGADRVLKLYPPVYASERDTEAAVLDAVAGQLAVPTPRVVACDALEGWGYILMTRLRGRPLVEAWPEIARAQQLELARALGASLAQLHAVPAPDYEAVCIDWSGFVENQRQTARERQQARGLDDAWLRQIPDFLARVTLPSAQSGALLHTEIMREHLLVQRVGDSWQLSGLFDFEPAMRGAPEYEFASVGLFFSCGDPALLRQVLLAYGYRREQLTDDLARSFLACTLLHQYANLPWYFTRIPPDPGVTTLDALATCWFGTRSPDIQPDIPMD